LNSYPSFAQPEQAELCAVLFIFPISSPAPKLVDPNMKTASTLTTPQTSTFTTPPRKFPVEKVVSRETVPGRPLTAEFAEDFKDSSNVTEGNGQHG
jgi:hypothetical protein